MNDRTVQAKNGSESTNHPERIEPAPQFAAAGFATALEAFPEKQVHQAQWRPPISTLLRAHVGNSLISRILQRELPAGGVDKDPEAPAEALRLNGLPMQNLLEQLAAKGFGWINLNKDALVHTPGVGPDRMALAVEAVLSGPTASDERLAAMMGEMQGMGLPDDQQEAVARYCGAFGLRAPSVLDKYVKGASGLKTSWATMTAVQRAQSLGDLAAASLEAAGVPRPTEVVVQDIGGDGGQWDRDRNRWCLLVTPRIGDLRATLQEIGTAAATIYHEARHGEQDFLVLRMYAAKVLHSLHPVDDLALYYPAPNSVLEAAIANPLPAGDPLVQKAREWLDTQKDSIEYEDRLMERDAHGTGNTVNDRIRGTPPDRSSQLRDPWIPTVKQQVNPPPP